MTTSTATTIAAMRISTATKIQVDMVVRILVAANRPAYTLPHIDLRRSDTRAGPHHFLIGAAKSLFTLRTWWSAGLEMTAAGVIVGGATYVLGLLIKVSSG